MVGKHEQIKSRAETNARAKAVEVAEKLKRLGAPARVSWWIQKWTTQEQITLHDASVVPL